MARQRWIQIDGKLVPAHEADRYRRTERGPMIQSDIEPYESPITGEQITSRSQHREHLRQHNMQEIGNEQPQWLKDRYEQSGIKPKFDRHGRRIA